MLNNTKLSIEGFNPADYAMLEENGTYNYLPYNVQRWWFNEVFPNGRIVTSIPQPDPEHTPGAYVSQVQIWKDASVERPDIIVSSRATPSDVDGIDPYQDCQRKAIAMGLKLLGFWLPVELPAHPPVNPATVGMAPENLVEEPAESSAAEPKPRRGRKKGVITSTSTEPEPENVTETSAEGETAEAVKATEEEAPVEEPVAEESAVEEPVVEEPVEEVPAMEEPQSEPVEEVTEEVAGMTKEQAEAVVVNYRRYKNITMGELMKSESGREIIKWFATSSRAKSSYPEYAEAAAVLTA